MKRRACRTVTVLAFLPTALFAQQRESQAIYGRITSDSGSAIAGANVVVTIAPSTESILGTSDGTGNYRIVVPTDRATGDYLLYIGALGKKPFRKRIAMATGDTAMLVNAVLASAISTLTTVTVRARRARPTATLGSDQNVVGTDGVNRRVDGVTNALPPELQGNLDAMATLVPGLSVTTNGVSAFGLGSSANMSTLNGVTFGGAAVPRDLETSTAFLSSPWDPTRGGSSGVLASTTVAPGTNVTNRRLRIALDAPQLQVTDRVAQRLGQQFANVQLSAGGQGAFVLDKYFYNYGIQASRQVASMSSLLEPDAETLADAGISLDSAARLTALLSERRIPLTRSGIPTHRVTTSARFLERFDRRIPPIGADAVPSSTWQLLVGGDYAESLAGSLTPTAYPSTAGRTRNGGALIQGSYTKSLGKLGDFVNETVSGVTYRDSRTVPYVDMPSGSVLLTSRLGEGDPTIGVLRFGGNSLLTQSTRSWAWEVANQTNFLIHHLQTLPVKLYLQSRFERYEQANPANRLGAFEFASLGDLANNTPTSFSRVLKSPTRVGGEWTGAAAAGGSWSTTKLTLAGGLRADANAFVALPTLNPALQSTFGERNDGSLSSISVSPRLGFNWYPSAVNPTAERGAYVFGGPLSRTFRGGTQVRGGIGQFRSVLPANLLSDAYGLTGLAGSTQRIVCLGPAAPTPDWQAYSGATEAIPTSCIQGANAFSDASPDVSYVSPSYQPSRAWRGTLGWTSTIRGNYVAVDAVYSLNLNQPGTIDRNFSGAPQFSLATEGARPVFVSPSSIAPATGAVSPIGSRRSPAFAQVREAVSDLRGDARQLTVYAIPNLPLRMGILTLGYTFIDARYQQRGFDGMTGADPGEIEWSRQPFVPRHQLVMQGARMFFGGAMGLTLSAITRSGFLYTPLVAGDVNGDGVGSDRAFVFDPASMTDTSSAAGLRALLSGRSSAQACLLRQVNRIAARNSCTGPWSTTMNVSILVPTVPRTQGRMQLSVNVTNPLGGLDQLIHGREGLHGWGSMPIVDPILYRIRGFDENDKRFRYEVNPRFGTVDPGRSVVRTPLRLTIEARYNYGRSAQEQRLELNLRVKPPLKGTRASVDSIKSRLMRAGFTDVFAEILGQADSVALTRVQMEQLQARRALLLARVDSIYLNLAAELHSLPSSYKASDALQLVLRANDSSWEAMRAESGFLRDLLTPAQIRRLPEVALRMLTVPNFRMRFNL